MKLGSVWLREILKKVGDCRGGFVAMDKGTTLRTDLLWARILVKMEGKEKPSSVNLLVGARRYELQIWWEIQSRVVEVFPRTNKVDGGFAEPREEGERKTCVVGRLSVEEEEINHSLQKELSNMVQQGSLKRRGSVGGHTLRPDFMRSSKEGSIIIYGGSKGVGSKPNRGGGGVVVVWFLFIG